MPKIIGRFIIYTADDEMPDCLCCDNCDADYNYCNKCGAEYGWANYKRTEDRTVYRKENIEVNKYEET